VSTRNLDATAPPSDVAPDSAEVLDSALVVRPAARVSPLAAAAAQARALAGGMPYAGADDDDGDFMVDPDATLNLPARPKSMEGRRAPSLLPAAPVAAAADEAQSRPRRPPTEDMRRKARNLFEQALKEHAAGKLGAARMNVKLATIYDPMTPEYQRVLDDWEDKPRPNVAATRRPEYVELYEEAQDLEDRGDIDGALDALERGLPLAPNAAAFHNRIGVILAMRKREFERAAAEIQRAITLEPDNAHYRNNLGKVLARANRRRDAAAGAR
jgi:Tfp pilus assembly protein PilF